MLLNEAPMTSTDIDAALDPAERLRQLARSCRRTADETIRASHELTERIRQQLENFAQTTEDRPAQAPDITLDIVHNLLSLFSPPQRGRPRCPEPKDCR